MGRLRLAFLISLSAISTERAEYLDSALAWHCPNETSSLGQ